MDYFLDTFEREISVFPKDVLPYEVFRLEYQMKLVNYKAAL